MKRYEQRVERYKYMCAQLALLQNIDYAVNVLCEVARDAQLNALNAAEVVAEAAAPHTAQAAPPAPAVAGVQLQVASAGGALPAPAAATKPLVLPAAQPVAGALAVREAGTGTSAAPSMPAAASPLAVAFSRHRRSRAMDMDHEDFAYAQQQQQQPARSSPSTASKRLLEQSGSAAKRLCQEQQQQQHEVPGPAAAAASPAPSSSVAGSVRADCPVTLPACSPARTVSRPDATPAHPRGAATHHVSLATPHEWQSRSGASEPPGTTAGSVSMAGGQHVQRGGHGGKSRMQAKIQTVLNKMARQEAGEHVSMKKQERVLSDYIKTAQKTMAKWCDAWAGTGRGGG